MKVLPGFKYLLEERHLSEETIKAFHLGAIDHLGLCYIDADFTGTLPQLDPRFKNSSMFPVQDLYGAVVGVSARPLVTIPGTKYINTVYEKGDHLYGLNQTWKYCLETKKAYVVEGNIDTMMMWQAGIKNVVGMLGSNFSLTQFGLLYRFVHEICFVPDGDQAGINFINKMLSAIPKKLSHANDITISLVSLPHGKDPDKFLQEYPKEYLFKLEKTIFHANEPRSALHV